MIFLINVFFFQWFNSLRNGSFIIINNIFLIIFLLFSLIFLLISFFIRVFIIFVQSNMWPVECLTLLTEFRGGLERGYKSLMCQELQCLFAAI